MLAEEACALCSGASTQLQHSPPLHLCPQELCLDLTSAGDELPSSEGMVDNRSQIYSRSQAAQVPTAQTTRRCWRSGLLWDFTKQTEQLEEECAAPGTSYSPSPGPQAGRSRGLGGLQDGRTHSRT